MSPYRDAWTRIKGLFEAGYLPAADLKTLGARHQRLFETQQVERATTAMIIDLQQYADHLERISGDEI